nr:tetratricopeptide ankyrin repeat and coiled-coil containing 1 [Colletotrichum truncatum]KAF6790228.1 tetratricopeptide ankyrin repeat and coiled-coil containing 1 [Colletotrichum truncatum]
MELHIDLENDRTNRRRLQNRMAQRKFRQARAEASNQTRAADEQQVGIAQTNVGQPPSRPMATTLEFQQHQPHVSPSAAISIPQFFHQPASVQSQPRSTPFFTPGHNGGSSSGSGSPGLGEFSFIESFTTGGNNSLSSYSSSFDPPLDFGSPRPSQANHVDVDCFLNLSSGGPRNSPGLGPGHPDVQQLHTTQLTQASSLGPSRGHEARSHQLNPHYQSGGSSNGGSPAPPQNPPSSSSVSTPGTGGGAPAHASPSSDDSHAPVHDRGWLSTLHIAARRGHERIVRALIERDIDCNEKDSDGRTALIHAAIDGHEPVARMLLAKGARISDLDRRQRSALHWAVLGGHEAVLKLLLEFYSQRNWEHGLDAYDELGWTALHIAVEKDFEPAVWMLLEAGADLHAKARKTCNGDDDEGDTRIHSGAKSKSPASSN